MRRGKKKQMRRRRNRRKDRKVSQKEKALKGLGRETIDKARQT
jgi:hypothetical protein